VRESRGDYRISPPLLTIFPVWLSGRAIYNCHYIFRGRARRRIFRSGGRFRGFLTGSGGEEFSTAVRQVAPPPQAPPFLSLRQTISSTSLTDCQAYSSSVLPIKFHRSGGKRLREIEERVPGPPQGGQMAGAQERRKRKTPPPLTGAALSLARAGRCLRYPPG
jgi:hypothetical protein